MVTTDYQVVQGSIFHIRDVTLFQWGNTCSARYKLHERAYKGATRVLHRERAREHSIPCTCNVTSVPVCLLARSRIRRRLARGARRPGAPRSSSFHLRPSPLLSSPLAVPVSKIIPTFNDYKNARPLFRESDPLTDHRRHSTPIRCPLSRLERGDC